MFSCEKCLLKGLKNRLRSVVLHLFLLKLVTQDIEHSKKEIIDEVTSKSNVQFYWSVIAIDLDKDIGQELLAEIVQLWLTV